MLCVTGQFQLTGDEFIWFKRTVALTENTSLNAAVFAKRKMEASRVAMPKDAEFVLNHGERPAATTLENLSPGPNSLIPYNLLTIYGASIPAMC